MLCRNIMTQILTVVTYKLCNEKGSFILYVANIYNINWRDVQKRNVVKNVGMSS